MDTIDFDTVRFGPELDAWIAEHIMGWKRRDGAWNGPRFPYGPVWMDGDTVICACNSWMPSEDIGCAHHALYQWREANSRRSWNVSACQVELYQVNENHEVTDYDFVVQGLIPLSICKALGKATLAEREMAKEREASQ